MLVKYTRTNLKDRLEKLIMKLVCDCGNEESFNESLNEIAERKRVECSGRMNKFKFNISSFRYIHFDCNVCGKKIRVYNKW